MKIENLSNRFLLSVAALSLVLNLGFVVRQRKLGSDLAKAQTLTVGTKMASLTVSDQSAESVTLKLDCGIHPTVVYLFAPSCSWCAKNLSNIQKLYAAKHNDYDFVAISTTRNGLADYLARTQLGMPVYSAPSDYETRLYHLTSTPQTIVVGSGGYVQHVWEGAYQAKSLSEINDYFNMGSQLVAAY